MTEHRYQISLPADLHPKDREPVFLVVKRNSLDQASQNLGRCARPRHLRHQQIMKIPDRRRHRAEQRTRTLADVAIVSPLRKLRASSIGLGASRASGLNSSRAEAAASLTRIGGRCRPRGTGPGPRSLKLYIGFTLRLSISSLLRTRYRRESWVERSPRAR